MFTCLESIVLFRISHSPLYGSDLGFPATLLTCSYLSNPLTCFLFSIHPHPNLCPWFLDGHPLLRVTQCISPEGIVAFYLATDDPERYITCLSGFSTRPKQHLFGTHLKSWKLAPRFISPFPISHVINPAAVRLASLGEWRCTPTCHFRLSLLSYGFHVTHKLPLPSSLCPFSNHPHSIYIFPFPFVLWRIFLCTWSLRAFQNYSPGFAPACPWLPYAFPIIGLVRICLPACCQTEVKTWT